MALLIPELICNTVYDIPLSFFKDNGIKLLFLDIDNTLVTYDDAHPTERNLSWFNMLSEEGIDVVFVSNNGKERVRVYAEKTTFEYHSNSKKPLVSVHKKILKSRNVKPHECASVGDQIFTDILSAHILGGVGILVSPIKDLTDPFTRFKRLWEKPFINTYMKRVKGDKNEK